MQYLILTILMNVIISAFFKVFPRYHINALQAIVVNYFVCVITGCLYLGSIPFHVQHVHTPWFAWAIIMGIGFISLFNLMAYNTRVYGITTTTIANKLSLVIPVIFSFFLYKEHAGFAKILGIVLAFPAVYLTTRERSEANVRHNLFWPALLFVGSGLLDTSIKYIECHFLPTPDEQAIYIIHVFAMAAVTGTVLVLFRNKKLQWRNVVAGVCVGIPNYFSIYFLIRALNSGVLESSAAIPAINIGILVASTFVAILFFKERANPLRISGLVLAIIAILLITLGDKWTI